jgi:DNA-binding response OmpR family regulator
MGGRAGALESFHLDVVRWRRVKKILVVEDDPVNQMILQDFLAANGYETVGASTGPEGIERFDTDAPDLLLVDIQLPRKNGFELLREIKGRPNGKSTPILLMSAVYNDRDQSSRTVQLGTLADGYLTKPFDLVQLLAQVRRLLGETA